MSECAGAQWSKNKRAEKIVSYRAAAFAFCSCYGSSVKRLGWWMDVKLACLLRLAFVRSFFLSAVYAEGAG